MSEINRPEQKTDALETKLTSPEANREKEAKQKDFCDSMDSARSFSDGRDTGKKSEAGAEGRDGDSSKSNLKDNEAAHSQNTERVNEGGRENPEAARAEVSSRPESKEDRLERYSGNLDNARSYEKEPEQVTPETKETKSEQPQVDKQKDLQPDRTENTSSSKRPEDTSLDKNAHDTPQNNGPENNADGGRHPPNSIVNTKEGRFRTDDNGNIHMYYDKMDSQWKLKPNCEYQSNGYFYRTDDKGRIVHVEGKIELSSEERKSLNAKVEDLDKETDDRGHLIADRFGGSNQIDNLIPQLKEKNRGEYKQFENKLADARGQGKDVRVSFDIIYDDDTKRPSGIIAEYTIDDRKYSQLFENWRD